MGNLSENLHFVFLLQNSNGKANKLFFKCTKLSIKGKLSANKNSLTVSFTLPKTGKKGTNISTHCIIKGTHSILTQVCLLFIHFKKHMVIMGLQAEQI